MKSKTMFKKFLYLSSLIFVLFLFPAISHAAPKVFYTDIISGPNTGGENNNGAYLSIFGKDFGTNINNIKVYVGSGEVARYIYLGSSLSRADIQQLSVQLGPNTSTGAIRVVVSGVESNTDQAFTVRSGNFYFISLTGNDSTGQVNDINRPYRTPNYLWTNGLNAGDFVIARGGNYNLDSGNEGLESGRWINAAYDRSGTTNNPMTFMGYPGETIKVYSSTGSVAFRTTRGDWFVLANMWGHINANSGKMFEVSGVTQDVDISTDSRFVNLLITGGGIAESGGSQFELMRAERFKLLGLTVRDSAEDPSNVSRAHNIYLGARMQDVEVGWCEISNIKGGRAALQTYTDNYSGFWDIEPCIDEIKIHNCIIHDVPQSAILLGGGTQDIWVYNNIIYNANQKDASWPMINMPAQGNHLKARIFNNTIYNSANNTLFEISNFGYDVEFVEFYNNVLFVTNPGAGYATSGDSGGLVNITSNNNIWYGSSSGLPSFTGANDRSIDPLFVNPSAGDFTLQSSSPAIDTGSSSVASVVAKDFNGNPRPMGTGYDIGAYEYNGPAVPMLQFSASNYNVSEGTATATITVTRIGSAAGAVSVNYATSNGTATAGSDYTSASGTLSWTDGNVASQTFTVPITNDTAVEGDEAINLTLSNPTGGAILGSQSTAAITILDNDGPPILRFENPSYSVSEGVGTATIRVLRTGGTSGAVSVNYATSNSTATAGSDYSSSSGTLSWAAGDTAAKQFTVTIINDNADENNETTNLALSNPTNGAQLGGTNPVALTITDDDSSTTTTTTLGKDTGSNEISGGGCGFVKDDDNGKGTGSGAASLIIMLILTLAGIAIARRFSNRFSYNL